MKNNRDADFLFELGSLRHTKRSWIQHLAVNCANDLEHSMRVAFIALILARRMGEGNEELILKMALTHDIAETRTSDLNYVHKMYVEADEARAVHDIFEGTILTDFEQIVMDYERRDSLEAKLVKDADNLDIDLELKELEEQGHTLPKKWVEFRQLVRNQKLHTDIAKVFWDEIQTASPSDWHMLNNKWLKMPNAGR